MDRQKKSKKQNKTIRRAPIHKDNIMSENLQEIRASCKLHCGWYDKLVSKTGNRMKKKTAGLKYCLFYFL